MRELPSSMRIFISVLLISVLGIALHFITTPKMDVFDSNILYATDLTKKDIKLIKSGKYTEKELDEIKLKVENSFDKRDEKGILSKYETLTFPEKDFRDKTTIMIKFDKKDSNSEAIRKVLSKLKEKDMFDIKIYYLAVPESRFAYYDSLYKIFNNYEEFVVGEENPLNLDSILVVSKGKVTYTTNNFSELLDKENENFYK